MRAGPPKIIETAVGLLLPPSAREHVLGDLRERYVDSRHYLADALSAVPGVVAGRLLRTTDFQLRAMEAGLLYLSFLVAAWAVLGARYVCLHAGFVRLLGPVALAFVALIVGDIYDGGRRRAPVVAAGLGVGCAAAVSRANAAFPGWILLWGGALGLALVSTLRMWFPPGGNRPRGEVL